VTAPRRDKEIFVKPPPHPGRSPLPIKRRRAFTAFSAGFNQSKALPTIDANPLFKYCNIATI